MDVPGGRTWTRLTDNLGYVIRQVCFVDEKTGWAAVSEASGIHKTTDGGRTWRRLNLGESMEIGVMSVFFTDQFHGWAVGWKSDEHGDHPKIFNTSDGGKTWSEQEVPGGDPLTRVCFINDQVGWAVGVGVIFGTTDGGDTWDAQLEVWGGEYYAYFQDVFFVVDESTGWVVGDGGKILTTDGGGRSWVPRESGTDQVLCAVSFADRSTGWTVGYNPSDLFRTGSILRTSDGGQSWNSETEGTNRWLFDVCFVDANTGWVVGEGGTIRKTTTGGASG